MTILEKVNQMPKYTSEEKPIIREKIVKKKVDVYIEKEVEIER